MTKVNKLLLATHNVGKVRELEGFLAPLGVTVCSARDLELKEPEETGATFSENAEIKARSGHLATGFATLADDSGLCVDALPEKLGVHTARYGGYEKLVEEMRFEKNRSAAFYCDLCLILPCEQGVEVHHFTGESLGEIAQAPSGRGGFGYDPVFIPTGYDKTYAALPKRVKQETSHRGRALEKLIAFLERL